MKKIIIDLPDNFGEGWDFDDVKLFHQSHAWAETYDRTENGNFAHEAIHRLQGIESSSMYVGMNCSVTFEYSSQKEIDRIKKNVQTIVDAFPERKSNQISVRGSNYWDAKVTEFDKVDGETEIIKDMPLRLYLAKFIPMSESHPSFCDQYCASVIEEYRVLDQSLKIDRDRG